MMMVGWTVFVLLFELLEWIEGKLFALSMR